MSFIDLAKQLGSTATRPVVQATGSAGDVYLCHPSSCTPLRRIAAKCPGSLPNPR